MLQVLFVDTVELDFCCPECNCSQWYCIDEDTKLYGCARCDNVCLFSYLLDIDNDLDGEGLIDE